MANYSSYKKVQSDAFGAGIINDSKISSTAFATWNVKWIYGSPNVLSGGCCCLWTVPTGVGRITFELWGSGGNGHGSCSWDRCHHYRGAGGGYYNSKTITTAPGCQYTICASGVYPCCSLECVGCQGCASYVNGYNLSNFCAIGGYRGEANTSWQEACNSVFECCLAPGNNGGDFGMGNHTGNFGWLTSQCHCHCQGSAPSSAPFLGTDVQQNMMTCWIRHGCWTVPYGNGGMGAMTTYCGSWDNGYGNTGGPGLVKITYV